MSVVNLPIKKITSKKFTWATRPTSSQVGDLILITDVGASDELFRWTGSRWAPANGQIILASKASNLSLTGTTTLTQIDFITVPGGLMSANGQLEIMSLWAYPSSANTKTLRIYFGEIAGTAYTSRAETTTAGCQLYTAIRAANSTTAQKGANNNIVGGLGANNALITTTAFDTSVARDISFAGILALSTETITLKGFKVTYRE